MIVIISLVSQPPLYIAPFSLFVLEGLAQDTRQWLEPAFLQYLYQYYGSSRKPPQLLPLGSQ